MTNETKSPAQAAPVVAASELSDEQILELDCLRLTHSDDDTEHDIASSSVIEFARRIESAVLAAATPAASVPAKPVAWIRFRSDGGYEGPIMDAAMEDVRKNSGAWTPLYAAPAVQQPAEGGWISIKDHMPAEWEMVLTCGSKKVDQAVMAWNARDGWQIETAHEWHSAYAPTHWRELPSPPQVAA